MSAKSSAKILAFCITERSNQQFSGRHYISIDIEANGSIPGAHSMLSLGAAAFDAEGVLRDIFAANLKQLDAVGLPVLVAYPAAYDAMWVEWYCHRFTGTNPLRRRAIDDSILSSTATALAAPIL